MAALILKGWATIAPQCVSLRESAGPVPKQERTEGNVSDIPSLEPKLAEMREGAAKRFPPLIELNRRMFAEVESSVIANALDIGDKAPDFELANAATDAKVKLSSVLAEGPAVLVFYRGHW